MPGRAPPDHGTSAFAAAFAPTAARSSEAGEELLPIFESSIGPPEPEQPDPDPDISSPGSWRSGGSTSSGQFGRPCRTSPWVSAAPWGEASCTTTSSRHDGETSGKSSLPVGTEKKAMEDVKKAAWTSGMLNAAVVIAITSLSSLNMLSLTAAKLAAGQGTFKFEYVTVTLMQEILKFCIASSCFQWEVWQGSIDAKVLNLNLLCETNFLKFGVPGLLYCLDGNFQYVILGFLQPAELAILWNFKIFATTLLLHVFMGRRYTKRQWISMAVLVFGCAATQASNILGGNGAASHTTAMHLATAAGAAPATGHMGPAAAEPLEAAIMVGLPTSKPPSKLIGVGLAMFGSCVAASGNVFCEYLVKDNFEASLHFQNMQLYFFGILLNLITLITKASSEPDSPIHGPGGFFAGYDGWVWLVVILSSLSGLAVSVALKYVDNIAVVFSHALSMIVVALLSAVLFSVMLSVSFTFGGSLVLASLYMFYSEANAQKSRGSGKDQDSRSLMGSTRPGQSAIQHAAQGTPMYCLNSTH